MPLTIRERGTDYLETLLVNDKLGFQRVPLLLA